jgi:hypothetical protein
MIAIARFHVPAGQAAQFRPQLERALEVFSEREGFTSGDFGLNVGSYRRALSSTAVKMEVVPLLATAIDEPGAYSRDL